MWQLVALFISLMAILFWYNLIVIDDLSYLGPALGCTLSTGLLAVVLVQSRDVYRTLRKKAEQL